MDGLHSSSISVSSMEMPRWLTTVRNNKQKTRHIRILLCAIVTFVIVFNSYFAFFPSVSISTEESHRTDLIPNIVHYTYLRKTDDSEFHISFQMFLSFYSALRLLKPTEIYIHVDFDETVIDRARIRGSKWTRMLLNAFPEVLRLNQVAHYTHANGMVIEKVEAKSDFHRWEQVYERGGVYMDWDSIPLRDATPLRESGFNNVIGLQEGGEVAPGCFMAKQHSSLAYIMKREQWTAFDGGWTTHSVALTTQVTKRLSGAPKEILVLEQQAMIPGSWHFEDIVKMYESHALPVPLNLMINNEDDPIARWENRAKRAEWEVSYSGSYFLHAFADHSGQQVPGFKGVSVKYILARDSNFALATWHLIDMGIKEGVFLDTDDEI